MHPLAEKLEGLIPAERFRVIKYDPLMRLVGQEDRIEEGEDEDRGAEDNVLGDGSSLGEDYERIEASHGDAVVAQSLSHPCEVRTRYDAQKS